MRNRTEERGKYAFLALWVLVLLAKTALAAKLPLFVDEAFYWQEGQHPAWAYSDLPGLTAWLTRIGVELGGHGTLPLRAPFLLLAAAIPWLVASITAREFGRTSGWTAATFALLLPLSGTLGLLAVPDAAMVVAALLCVDAVARLMRGVSAGGSVELALGLTLGALSHYRFIAVLGVGLLVLLWMTEGRRLLRDPRVLIALALGAAAWTPLIAWNMENAEAGLRFQLVDRHPWAFHADGAWFLAIQTLLVTPLLLAALAAAAWRHRRDAQPVPRLFALVGALIVLGFFVLGFFADTERVSFHWPLPGYVLLLPLLPGVLASWPPAWRRATYVLAALGLVSMLGYYAAVSVPSVRGQSAAGKWYPENFAGWEELAAGVRQKHSAMPRGTRIVADNFKIGAELGFALGDPDIAVLDHPLNRIHGRAPQLRLWGLEVGGKRDLGGAPALLVVGISDIKFRDLLTHYQDLCRRFGSLLPYTVISADHGSKRFLLVAVKGGKSVARNQSSCAVPVVAHIDQPAPGAEVGPNFVVSGWALRDHVGVQSIAITLDGRPMTRTDRRYANHWIVEEFLRGGSQDPGRASPGFEAEVDASGFQPGIHQLGLTITGGDGKIETLPAQPVEIASPPR